MKFYLINNETVEFDETLTYCDFLLENGVGNVTNINWVKILEYLEQNRWEEIKQIIWELSRWANEAPRKRMYHEMIKNGMHVVSNEQFFLENKEIIDYLENTGKLAKQICEIYKLDPMKPIRYEGQAPIPLDKLQDYQ